MLNYSPVASQALYNAHMLLMEAEALFDADYSLESVKRYVVLAHREVHFFFQYLDAISQVMECVSSERSALLDKGHKMSSDCGPKEKDIDAADDSPGI